jgi:hypothetical protein
MRRTFQIAAVLGAVLAAGCSPDRDCVPGTVRCGDACVVLAGDPANCGACGTVCSLGEVCSGGSCALSCAAPLTTCEIAGARTCIDTLHDPAHCGACGSACPDGELCSDGSCAATCSAPLVACEAAGAQRCVDTRHDPANCGGCGVACDMGEVCGPAGCAAACAEPLVTCQIAGGASCADVRTDPGNCGGCGMACAPGQACTEGGCIAVCSAPETACGTGHDAFCADLLSSRTSCGACGLACGGGATCVLGRCVAAACDGQVGLPGLPIAEAGARTVALSAGDMDADGDLDLAMASYDGHSVTIVLNDGNGRFVIGRTIPFVAFPERLAVGRLDGDARADLVVFERTTSPGSSGAIKVILDPSGAGTLAQTVSLPTDASLALADLDADGALDLVLGTAAGLTVRRGSGGGTFLAAEDYAQVAGNYAIVVADLDGDGDQDVATSAWHLSGVRVRWNDGTGGLSATSEVATGAFPISLAGGDVEGDGTDDLAIHASDGSTWVAHGPALALSHRVGEPGSGWDAKVLVADVDGDGRGEVFSGVYGARFLRWWRPGAGGGFTSGPLLPVGEGPDDLVAADVDGDGDRDLVVARGSGDGAAVVRNEGGWFAAAAPLGLRYDSELVLADLDGDHRLDLLGVTGSDRAPQWTLTAAFGHGDGTMGQVVEAGGVPYPSGVAAGDVDGDGTLDLAAVSEGSRTLSLALNRGGRAFAPAVATDLGGTPLFVALGDLDADGRADAVVGLAGSEVAVLHALPGGTLSAPVLVGAGLGPADGVIADLDRDGRADVALANSAGISILHGRGDLSFEPAVSLAAPCQYGASIAAADLDGDRFPDLVLGCNLGEAVVYLDAGVAATEPLVLPGHSPLGAYGVATADVDADGLVDVLVANGEGSIGFHRNLGGTFAGEMRFFGWWVARRLAVGDLDHDGRADAVTDDDIYLSRCVP